jgi:hypothetical protein
VPRTGILSQPFPCDHCVRAMSMYVTDGCCVQVANMQSAAAVYNQQNAGAPPIGIVQTQEAFCHAQALQLFITAHPQGFDTGDQMLINTLISKLTHLMLISFLQSGLQHAIPTQADAPANTGDESDSAAE